jgi:myo-inositol catabolism protein IolC
MKQQLAELIEAYAAARVSGNRMLLEYIADQLNDFISQIELTKTEKKRE